MLDAFKELIMQYGYIVLYGLLAAGIVGVPVPDEILMTFVGYLTSVHYFSFGISLAVSFAGAMSGMIISYLLGKRVGKPFLSRYGKWVKLTPARLQMAENWFCKYGLLTVSFGYFIPGIRHFTCYLAGMSGVKFGRYLLFAGSGALVWCTTFITLGYFIGSSLDNFFELFHHYVGRTLLILIPVLILVGYLIWQKKRNRTVSATRRKLK